MVASQPAWAGDERLWSCCVRLVPELEQQEDRLGDARFLPRLPGPPLAQQGRGQVKGVVVFLDEAFRAGKATAELVERTVALLRRREIEAAPRHAA